MSSASHPDEVHDECVEGASVSARAGISGSGLAAFLSASHLHTEIGLPKCETGKLL